MKMVTDGRSWWLHNDTRHSDQARIAQERRLTEAFFREAWYSAPSINTLCVDHLQCDRQMDGSAAKLAEGYNILMHFRPCPKLYTCINPEIVTQGPHPIELGTS